MLRLCMIFVMSALLLPSCVNAPVSNSDQLVSQNKPNVQQFAQMMIQPNELSDFNFETTKINALPNCSMSLSRRAVSASSNTTLVYTFVFCNSDQASQELLLGAAKNESWFQSWVDVSDVLKESKAQVKQGFCYETKLKLIGPGKPTPTANSQKTCGLLTRYGQVYTEMYVSSDSGSPLTPSLSQMWEIMFKREERFAALNVE